MTKPSLYAAAAFAGFCLVLAGLWLGGMFKDNADYCFDHYQIGFVPGASMAASWVDRGTNVITIRGDHRLSGVGTYKAMCGMEQHQVNESKTMLAYREMAQSLQIACLARSNALWDARAGKFRSPPPSCDDTGHLLREDHWLLPE